MGWLKNRHRHQLEKEIEKWEASGSYPPVLVRMYYGTTAYEIGAELLMAHGYTIKAQTIEKSSGGRVWHVTYVRGEAAT